MTLALGEKLPAFLNIKKLVKAALGNLFDGFKGLVEPNLFRATYRTLNHAIGEGMGKIDYRPDAAFVAQLRKSGAWFAARKTYQQKQELAKLLVNDEGTGKRTWTSFKKLAKGIVTDYNETWLRVEYNTAIASARNAGKWQQYEAERGTYPNLEYLPSVAATPRDEHKPYYHVVRPVDDDFWVKHYPPSAYNCKCGVAQSDGDVTDLPERAPKPAPGLDHNAGQTGELFSKTHPYSAELDEELRKRIDEEGERLAAEDDAE